MFKLIENVFAIVGMGASIIFSIIIVFFLIKAIILLISRKKEKAENLNRIARNVRLQEFEIMELKHNFLELKRWIGNVEVLADTYRNLSETEKNGLCIVVSNLNKYSSEIDRCIERYESLASESYARNDRAYNKQYYSY